MKIVRTIILILLLLAIAAAGYWYLTTQNTTPASTALTGSGTVETTQVAISPEISGRIVDIFFGEGDPVKAGDTLFRLDDSLIVAQKNQAHTSLAAAQAGLEASNTSLAAARLAVNTAQDQYDLALAAAHAQSQPARSASWTQSSPSTFDQPVWYFTHTEEISAAVSEVSTARDSLSAEQADFSALVSTGPYVNLASTETRLANARAAFLDASDVLDRAQAQDSRSLRDAAQQIYDSANTELDAAQQAYDELLTTQEAQDILEARAKLAAAQERYDTAIDRYNALLTGEDSLSVKAAADGIAQAQANVTAAESKVTQAQAGIDQAQAALDLIDVQLGKLVVTSPVDGVVLSRNIEPGEVVMPGATAFTLGQLDNLTITVYIPEDHYGEVKLGDTARVNVDSFPGQDFNATVTRIADQAEFTPRNVQTVEGRRSTVFAVELAVQNSSGMLKPGMPADVTFGQP